MKNEKYYGGRYEDPGDGKVTRLNTLHAYPEDGNLSKGSQALLDKGLADARAGRISAYPQDETFWTKGDYIKAGVYIAVLVILACIGLCGCGTDDDGLQPCAVDDGGANDVLNVVSAPRWQTGYVPEECAEEVQKRDGFLYACPPAYSCWQSQGASRCMCLSGPSCARKAEKQYDSRNCICAGMPGDWDGSKL